MKVDPSDLGEDVIVACANLVDRAGAAQFELGYDDEQAKSWYAHALYQGARLRGRGDSPAAACMSLALRVLTGAACKCGRTVSLVDTVAHGRCRWRIVGQRWEAGCTAASIDMPAGSRGNLAKLQLAVRRRKGGK